VIKSKFILILLFFFVSNVSNAETQSTKLNKLFKILETIDNKTDAGEVEKEIWTLWNNHPKSKQLTYKLELGTELMYEGNYLYALQVFNNVIKSDPEWSEAWNKRATLLFLMKNYQQSLDDINITLSIEPRHFGALSGRAQIFIRLEEYQKALDALNEAKKIHPVIKGNKLIKELEKLIQGFSI
jgi:tetratricopeptide (TPR) repeat protein